MASVRRQASGLRTILVVMPCLFGVAQSTPLLFAGHGSQGHSLLNHSGNSSGLMGLLGPLLGHNNLLLDHHKDRRSTHELHKPTVELNDNQPLDGINAEQIIHFAPHMAVETLNLLRLIALPIVDRTLSIPANVIQQLVLNNGSEPSLVAMAGLSPNATALWFNRTHITETLERALHLNGSSLNETADHLHKFPRNLVYRIGNSSLYNSTSVAAHSAAHMGERLLLSPMEALLALARPPAADGSKRGVYSPSLNSDHLHRHLENFKRFLGAAHHNMAVVEPVQMATDKNVKPKEDAAPAGSASEAKPQGSEKPPAAKPEGGAQ